MLKRERAGRQERRPRTKRARPVVYHVAGRTLHPVERLHLSLPVTQSQVRAAVKAGELKPEVFGTPEKCVTGEAAWAWLATLKGGR